MGDPRNTEDVQKAIEVIKVQGRPPFECPFCKKSYQSLTGAFYHLGAAPPHNDLIPRCIVPAPTLTVRSTGRNTPKSSSRSQSPASVLRKKNRLPLTYEESQRLVEVKLSSDYFRVQIDDELVFSSSKDHGSDQEDSGAYSNPATPINSMKSKGKCSSKSSKSSKRKGISKLTLNLEENSKPDQIQLPSIEVEVVDDVDYPDAPDRANAYFRYIEQSLEEMDDIVEYDMDDEDYHWLDMINEKRKEESLPSVSQDCFELLMDRFEKECFFESHLTTNPSEVNPYNIDENAVCCICNDGECHNTNAILFCDMCNLAVHQECYGIPYIPEGQWLCRRCMHSPSRMVSCVLCPNKGGAFKQTSEGRWSHMLCALWIPEVQFANPVFLEPIDNIEKIPPARWRLTCYVCKKRYGACIQCSSKNCFIAFHVSCAQQKGFYMKVEPCSTAESGIKKVAYCKMHSPRRGSTMEEVIPVDVEGTDEAVEDQEGEGGAKEQEVESDPETALKPRASVPPIVNLPFVPQHRLNRISAKVNLARKTQFIPMLVSYWKLKRQSRNGVPLIRRLQASSHGQRVNMYKLSEEELDTLKEQLSVWKNLRHDLERVRMLAELVRRREKQKRELVHLTHQVFESSVSSDVCLMKKILTQLKKKDAADIFADPVPLEDVPDYLDVIKEPMDFSTMEKKINSHKYLTLDDFERDFTLVWRNAMTYNEPTTVYYRAALRIKLEGQRMLKVARDNLVKYAADPMTGISQLFTSVLKSQGEIPNPSVSEGNNAPNDSSRKELSDDVPVSPTALEEKLEILQQQLLSVDKQPVRIRAQKKKELELEVAQLRKQVKRKRKAALNSSGIDPAILLDIALSPEPPKQTRSSRKTASSASSHQNTTQESNARLKSPTPESSAQSSGNSSKSQNTVMSSSTGQERDSNEKKSHSRNSHGPPKRRRTPGKQNATSSEKKRQVESEMSPEEDVHEHTSASERSRPKRSKPVRKGEVNKTISTDSETLDTGAPLTSPSSKTRPRTEQVDGTTADTEDHVSDTGEGEEKRPKSSLRKSGTKRQSGQRRKAPTPKRNSSEEKLERSITDKDKKEQDTVGRDVENIPGATTEDMLTAKMSPRRNQRVNPSISKSSRRSDVSHRSLGRKKPVKVPLSSTDDEVGDEKRYKEKVVVNEQVVPQKLSRKEESESENLISGVEEDDDNSSSESSTSSSTANEIPFADLGIEPYEGDGLHHWDVVWAKCPGYPLYPALIVDPRVPRKGFKYYGAQVKCPNDEVFKLKGKAPKNSFLVNFFDARQTWYWLPGSKLDKLGSSHLDETVIKQCPTRSKRAVHQAYQRAMSFMKTVAEGKSRESQKGPHEPIPVNGPTTGLSKNDGTSNSVPPSESDRLGTIEENSLETPPVNNLDGVQQGEHQRVNIWDRNSDEVAAAEQLALLNSYVPASFHEGTNRVVLEESRTTINNNQHTAVETGPKDRSQACEDMDTSLPQGHCKLQNASREDEFIGEDTSTSSVSGTPEVSSIA